jgi:hypothetical protein
MVSFSADIREVAERLLDGVIASSAPDFEDLNTLLRLGVKLTLQVGVSFGNASQGEGITRKILLTAEHASIFQAVKGLLADQLPALLTAAVRDRRSELSAGLEKQAAELARYEAEVGPFLKQPSLPTSVNSEPPSEDEPEEPLPSFKQNAGRPVRKTKRSSEYFNGLEGKNLLGQEVIVNFSVDGKTQPFTGTVVRQTAYDKVHVLFSDGDAHTYAMTGSQGAELAKALRLGSRKRARNV